MSATNPISSHIGSIMNMVGIAKEFSPNLVSPTAGLGKPQGDQVTISHMAQMMQQFLNMEMQDPGEQGELDLGHLGQLRQRGDMLAGMLQMTLKNFESGLMTGLKSAGIDSTQNMSLKNGDDGLFLLNDLPNKNAIENQLNGNGKLREQFEEMSGMAKILELLGQIDAGAKTGRSPKVIGAIPASEYARQAQPVSKPSQASFVINIIEGNATGSLE